MEFIFKRMVGNWNKNQLCNRVVGETSDWKVFCPENLQISRGMNKSGFPGKGLSVGCVLLRILRFECKFVNFYN